MISNYTIIIPVFNEKLKIKTLLKSLENYHNIGHEIIIIDDGSTDGSKEILNKCDFIHLINQENNQGKGIAVIQGLKVANNNRIVIFDGDLELNPLDIKKLMILDEQRDIRCVFASRYKNLYQFKNTWDFGNLIFTMIFNLFNNIKIKDALCCAKSFFLSDVNIKNLKSSKFDIDVEIASMLIKKTRNIRTVYLSYNRRGKVEGKKLKMRDGALILKRILKST